MLLSFHRDRGGTIIRDEEPRMSSQTFTQLLSSEIYILLQRKLKLNIKHYLIFVPSVHAACTWVLCPHILFTGSVCSGFFAGEVRNSSHLSQMKVMLVTVSKLDPDSTKTNKQTKKTTKTTTICQFYLRNFPSMFG